MNSLACIITHYGPRRITLDCLASLSRVRPFPRIIVVCNTTHEEADMLAAEATRELTAVRVQKQNLDASPGQADILVACAGTNLGFARACNLGLRMATAMPSVRHAWLLNNDTEVAPEAATALLRSLQMQPRSVLGTAVVRHDAPEQLELVLGCRFSPWTTRIRPVLPGALLQDVPTDFTPSVDYVYGASFAFPLALLEAIGMLNEAFFLYYEEHDFCLRARQAGYTLGWCREAVVRHRHGQSSGLCEAGPSEARKRAHFHETLSTFLFLRAHHAWALPIALAVRTLAKLALLPLRREAWLLPGYFEALRTFFRHPRPQKPRPTNPRYN